MEFLATFVPLLILVVSFIGLFLVSVTILASIFQLLRGEDRWRAFAQYRAVRSALQPDEYRLMVALEWDDPAVLIEYLSRSLPNCPKAPQDKKEAACIMVIASMAHVRLLWEDLDMSFDDFLKQRLPDADPANFHALAKPGRDLAQALWDENDESLEEVRIKCGYQSRYLLEKEQSAGLWDAFDFE